MKKLVIGASLGRTGTYSLKLALERLGFGPCLHMSDFSADPVLCDSWLSALKHDYPDWTELLQDYGAIVDWPGCNYIGQLIEHFPHARVIYLERDFESWFHSIRQTIGPALQWSANIPPEKRSPFIEFANREVQAKTFRGHLDRQSLARIYRQHRETVSDIVHREKLLCMRLANGWGPLCEFLECPVPDEAFPHANPSAGFIQTLRGNRRASNRIR